MRSVFVDDTSRLARRKARYSEETDYDRAFRGSFGRYMTEVESRALERVFPTGRASRLLDLGCGHGRFLRWLATRAERLLGLDCSWRLLGMAAAWRRGDEALGVPVDLSRGSAQELPFAEGSLDSCYVRARRPASAGSGPSLCQIRRVLEPDGSLVLVQYLLSPHGLIRALNIPMKAALRWFMRAAGRDPFDEPTRWTTRGRLRRQLARAGFSVERETGAWLFPLQYFRSRRSNDAFHVALRLAEAHERLARHCAVQVVGRIPHRPLPAVARANKSNWTTPPPPPPPRHP